jgi:hypothetical protein
MHLRIVRPYRLYYQNCCWFEYLEYSLLLTQRKGDLDSLAGLVPLLLITFSPFESPLLLDLTQFPP